MASFRADLEVDGVIHPLSRLHFYSSRKRDPKGRPSSKSSWIVVAAIDVEEDSTITGWMVDKNGVKDATITYYNSDDDSVLKTWTLKKAMCYSMTEKFIADAEFMSTTLLITGEEISNGNATLKYDA
ncbi:hypothetical protein HNQ92_003735 [Rhabdobacter roseus]|uniref:Uncharacterized protein n=1 Tax=Rhabdobacter roseus TaxID=1655419 RepID=A0A840TRM7_9BACT|nr:type VI secretion system tube protein TssD [Rhabdobacter roseus]MBB5285575.1 hypothetical protein [Rhabdobacter roseus]